MTSTHLTKANSSAWAALRYREFRWMYTAMIVSFIGSSMQNAAINWHVWTITQSELALGLVGLVRILPIIVFSLVGGVVADAVDRRRLLIRTQTLLLTTAGLLALATLGGSTTIWMIYLLTAISGGIVAFDQPARNALLPALIPERELPNATRLNVLMFTFTSVLGPMIAGWLLARVSPGIAYAVNAASFLPVVLVLLWLRQLVLNTRPSAKRDISFKSMLEGWHFVRNSPPIWSSMLLDFVATFFASAQQLMPVYATDILKVNAEGYGLLSAAPAIGAALGAVLMAQYGSRIKQHGTVMVWSVGFFGAATIVFGLSAAFVISLVAMAITGFADAVSAGIRSPMRQILTPDHLRGRMLGVNMIFFMGGPQLGEFEAGLLAQLTTPVFSVVSGGVATILAVAAIAYVYPSLRAYREDRLVRETPA
jgi:MFS family permease